MAINPDYVGRTYPVSEPYEVTRVKIAEFADAIGDPNPVYRDAAAAQGGRASGRDRAADVRHRDQHGRHRRRRWPTPAWA